MYKLEQELKYMHKDGNERKGVVVHVASKTVQVRWDSGVYETLTFDKMDKKLLGEDYE